MSEPIRIDETAIPHPPVEGNIPPLQALRERVRALHPTRSPEPTLERAALFLLAALRVGQNTDKLARYTGLPPAEASRHARRLCDNGVWQAGRTICQWREGDPATAPAFWLDAAVAAGRLCRRESDVGGLEWAPAGYWRKGYELDPEPSGTCNRYHDPLAAPEEPARMAAEPEEGEELGAEAAASPPVERRVVRVRPEVERPAPSARPLPPRLERPRPAPVGADLFPGTAWLG